MNKWENVTHDQERNQSIETGTAFINTLELA
jgi:hypothetical protein